MKKANIGFCAIIGAVNGAFYLSLIQAAMLLYVLGKPWIDQKANFFWIGFTSNLVFVVAPVGAVLGGNTGVLFALRSAGSLTKAKAALCFSLQALLVQLILIGARCAEGIYVPNTDDDHIIIASTFEALRYLSCVFGPTLFWTLALIAFGVKCLRTA